MTNEFKKTLKQAGPSTPVSVIGLSEVPNAGDKFMAFPTDKQAREIALKRKLAKEETKRQGTSAMSLEDLYNRAQEGEIQDINIIVKADTNGSAEAIKSSLDKLSTDKIRIHVIHCTSGAITESDIMLASASHAIIYGFNVRPSSLIQQKAEEEKVEIRLHRIIYDLLNEMQDAMKGMLKKEQVEKVLGQAEVRSLIKVSKVGTIAGCYVTSGLIKSNSLIRLLRNGIVVYEGKLGSLRRFKDDVKEVKEGFECGLTIENYNDLKELDIVESYEMVDKD